LRAAELRVEAFSEGKDPARPDANEDAVLLLPDRAYAVIDGVSDRTGVRYDGMLAGRYAAQLVRRHLEALLVAPDAPEDPWAIVQFLSAAIAAEYHRLGTMEQARANWGVRLAATLALVLTAGDVVRVVLVGDSGLRINGATIIQMDKDLDRITATLRRCAWHVAAARTGDRDSRERISRQVAWHGAGQDAAAVAPLLNAGDLARIGEEAMERCVTALPHVPRHDIAWLVERGIVHGQGRYQNVADNVLGYSCLDGFAIPRGLTRVESWPRAEVHTIELFTDGYFHPSAGFGVDAWEEAFQALERNDPAKIGAHLSPRGSTSTLWADDRSYVGVVLR
jgi:hypothetical protein